MLLNSEDVVLPHFEVSENSPRIKVDAAIKDISTELRSAVCFIEDHKMQIPAIMSIDDYFYALADYFESKDSLHSSILSSLFKNKKIFHASCYTDSLLDEYGKSISYEFFYRGKEQRGFVTANTQYVWLLCSPCTLLATLTIIVHPYNEKVSKLLVNELEVLASAAYNIDVRTETKRLSDLHLLKPLLRQIELYERTKTLLACTENLRVLSKEEGTFDFFSFNEVLQQLSNFVYLSESTEAFKFGVSYQEEFLEIQSELLNHKNNIIVQDQIFLTYVSNKSEAIVSLILDLNQKIKISKSSDEIIRYTRSYQDEISYIFTLMVLLGKSVYTLDSINALFKKEYLLLLENTSEDRFLNDLCKVILPFTSVSIEDAYKNNIPESYLDSIKRIFDFLRVDLALGDSVVTCVLELNSPLRFYKITELMSRDLVSDELKFEYGIEHNQAYALGALIDHWLLKKEAKYIDTLVECLFKN